MPELWTNWAGEQRCAPERIVRPADEGELTEALAGAAGPVRVVGSGHSFTDIACSDGTLIDLGSLNRVAAQDGELVTVEAGITLHELGERLAERGLAMENQGDIDRQTLAGALATATHGTGARYANLSSQVVGMWIAGERVPDEELPAARVSLGALGPVTRITLRCVPLFSLRRVDEPRPLRTTLDRFDELADSHDHFELYAFPYTDTALVRLSERGDFRPEPPSAGRLFVQERLLENAAIALSGKVGAASHRLIPAVNQGLERLLSRQVRTDRSHRVYASRRDVKFTEMEYALPRERGVEAVRAVLEVIERRRLPVGFPIEVRVVKGDDAPLSTAYGRDSVYVAVHQFSGMEFETYFRAVEAIMDPLGGRPHWGKRHYQTAATLEPRYPEWERFQEVRSRLDPAGRFTNGYVERVLGPSRTAG